MRDADQKPWFLLYTSHFLEKKNQHHPPDFFFCQSMRLFTVLLVFNFGSLICWSQPDGFSIIDTQATHTHIRKMSDSILGLKKPLKSE